MAGIEEAMKILRKPFDKYAKKDGDKKTLSKRAFSSLLKAELPELAGDNKQLNHMFKEFDEDGDGTISFSEYLQQISELMVLMGFFEDL
uniref:EF-hand domain-containing protein n=1 Tax=Cyprinodon variegatus TaxID=28743 RepID=A0A3Q2DKB2_CYPVA